jgi:hypothetical protein
MGRRRFSIMKRFFRHRPHRIEARLYRRRHDLAEDDELDEALMSFGCEPGTGAAPGPTPAPTQSHPK